MLDVTASCTGVMLPSVGLVSVPRVLLNETVPSIAPPFDSGVLPKLMLPPSARSATMTLHAVLQLWNDATVLPIIVAPLDTTVPTASRVSA